MGVILNKQSWHLNEEEENINKKELNLWVMHIRMVEKRGSVLLHLVLFFINIFDFVQPRGGGGGGGLNPSHIILNKPTFFSHSC